MPKGLAESGLSPIAAAAVVDDDRCMTETPQQDRVDTDHLRDYSQLRRSLTDRKVAGVAGGLGRHLNIDPTILRVAFVVLAFFGGAGFLLYGALWLFVPEEGKDQAAIVTTARTRNAILIGAAVFAVLLIVGDSWGNSWFPWPLAIVGLVVALILMNREKPMSTTYPSQPEAPRPDAATTGGDVEQTTAFAPGVPTDTYSGAVPPATPAYPVQQPPAPRPHRGPLLFWFTVALLAVALGALGLYDVAYGGVADAAYPALALTVVGLMLLVGAWFGRAGGLILLGLVASIALLATSVAEPRFTGERQVAETPTKAVQVRNLYSVPAGTVLLDMSNIRDVERLDGRTIQVQANAGRLVVTLPEGVDANVNADVAVAGEAKVLGETRDGTDVSLHRTIDGGPDAPEINLNLDLVVGSIEVRQ